MIKVNIQPSWPNPFFLYAIYYMAQKNFFLWEQNGKFLVDKTDISCQLVVLG